MAPIIPFPSPLNHQEPNLNPSMGWLNPPACAIVMPTHLVEGAFDERGGHFLVHDTDGELACEVWLDAIPGLDVFSMH